MDWRYFDAKLDLEAAIRIWHEIGWINREASGARSGMEVYTSATRGYVGLVHEQPACFVFRAPGTIRHLQEDLPLAAITGVATGRNARKQGLAMNLTARAVAEAAREGAAVAGLSTFEQGFYNRLGFGNGAYEHLCQFDPDRLTVDANVRPPQHLDLSQAEAIHDARLNRRRRHGTVCLDSPLMTRAALSRLPNGFGLGYYDDGTETPSHFLCCATTQTMRGPYWVEFMAWKTPDQFMELLGLIKQWGDQVRLVMMTEPAGIQVQDLIDRPTQLAASTEGGNFAAGINARAVFQYRILDLAACIRATRLPGPPLAFNLELTDPLSERPSAGVDWPGVAGQYRVEFGPESRVGRGLDVGLPTLTASIGAFTRLWFGVRPATGLAITDSLSGPPALLNALDDAFCLPTPITDWPY